MGPLSCSGLMAATSSHLCWWQALLPLVLLILLLVANLQVFGDGSLGGPNQFALCWRVLPWPWWGAANGERFSELIDHAVQHCHAVPVLILLLIGSLTGAWLLSGTVPATIARWRAAAHSPRVFPAATLRLVCAVVSLATGSSWSTRPLQASPWDGRGACSGSEPVGLVAGCAISGTFRGQAEFAPTPPTWRLRWRGAVGHIRHALNTTPPSMGIALLLFGGIGLLVVRPGFTAQLGPGGRRHPGSTSTSVGMLPASVVVVGSSPGAWRPCHCFLGFAGRPGGRVVFQGELLERA